MDETGRLVPRPSEGNRRQLHEVEEVAVRGKILHHLILEARRDAGPRHVDQGRARVHGDRLGNRGQPQRRVDGYRPVELDVDVRAQPTHMARNDAVGPEGQDLVVDGEIARHVLGLREVLEGRPAGEDDVDV